MAALNFQTMNELTNTIDASVAQNWHQHFVPVIEKQINEWRETKQSLLDCGYSEHDDIVADVNAEIQNGEDVLQGFYEKWPKPKHIPLADSDPINVERNEYYDALGSAKFVKSLPEEPLTLIVHGNKSLDDALHNEATLLYQNADGDHIKAPNIWYNHPKQRNRIEWPIQYHK